jgi:hypothetical protein
MLYHRGTLNKPLQPRTCRAGTLLATLAGRPTRTYLDLTAPWPGPGLELGIPLMQGEQLLRSFAHRSRKVIVPLERHHQAKLMSSRALLYLPRHPPQL